MGLWGMVAEAVDSERIKGKGRVEWCTGGRGGRRQWGVRRGRDSPSTSSHPNEIGGGANAAFDFL